LHDEKSNDLKLNNDNIKVIDLDESINQNCKPQNYRDVLSENLLKIIERVNSKFGEIDQKVGLINEQSLV